ncbi:MAG: hydantoinase/oxoprolinase family protein [Methanosarcina flavescens]|jgi:probable H4MPT-linked C1 transfer pathway protein|uniref:H4MPT-linked C1 transfer pathway protein n=1 Tax=Methanosarcina flavescens TaxID=1715806 RepID=A0A660HPG7_9EURY|nr:hydantoinase/oxoprolinase family protein [Methanosarcina flavescens]AYK14019.1 H4MPT-linked C1 transfer pathway protein [Methanosarcina flavescens]NLK32779.1 H4MPT-linked C1 transfer pathway protein [Methanosarcina flavescens]
MNSKIIGLDIGGANTKLASSDGKIVELHYLPLWKNTRLPEVLEEIAQRLQPEKVAVVMTGELADCFEDKEQGIIFIKACVDSAFGPSKVLYVNNMGRLQHETDDIRDLAAANWAASARLIGKELGDCIFVDVGSTTSDIIPIVSGEHKAGLTDFERLCRSELVYTGTLRTNLAALLEKVKLERGWCRTASELFATTSDAYLLLGKIDESMYTCETADGAGRSKTDAMRRLARLVCADLSEIREEEIYEIATQVKEKQVFTLAEAISEVAERNGLKRIAAAGLGEFLIKEAAEKLDMEFVSISSHWGEEISKVFPAYAAARLIEM